MITTITIITILQMLVTIITTMVTIVHMHVYMYVYRYRLRSYLHTYIHTYMHACIHTYIHTYIHAYILHIIYICIYIHTYIYIYIYIYMFPSEGDGMSKSPPEAHDSHSFIQTIQTNAASTSSTIHTADKTSCAGHERKGLTPSDRWAISIRPHSAEVGLKPMASASSQANCAVQANRKGHPCTMRKNRSTSPAGVLPYSEEPARAPRAVVF